MTHRAIRRIAAAAATAALTVVLATGSGSAGRSIAPRLQEAEDLVPAKQSEPAKFARHRVLVEFDEGTSSADAARALAVGDARLIRRIHGTNFVVAEAERRQAPRVARELRKDPRVERVTLDYRREAFAEPNDPLYSTQQSKYLRSVRLPEAWEREKASSEIVVAVLDTGVDLDHPDLAGKILPGRDVVNGDSDAQDDEGHGTLVAGIAAASTDNGLGVAGAAWNARILPVKVLDLEGYGWDSEIAEGITWAADEGADVINLSLGGPEWSGVMQNAVTYAAGKGAMVVAAAGNESSARRHYPAALDNVVAVSATDSSGTFAWFSNRGWWVDLAAPGIDIASTVLANGPVEAYGRASGTSFAAPLVAGAAALLRAAQPGAPSTEIVRLLTRRSHDHGPIGADPSYGAGRVDAAAPLGAAIDPPEDAVGDADGVPDRASPLAEETSGTMFPENDTDWWRFGVEAPGWYGLTLTPPPPDGSLRAAEHDAVLEVYGPNHRQLARADAELAGGNESVLVPAHSAGTYYIKVADYAGSRAPGPYRLELERVEAPPDFSSTYLPVGTSPEAAAIGDVTGDGRLDLVVGTGRHSDPENDEKLWLYVQQPDGRLAAPTTVFHRPNADDSVPLGLGDLDADGQSDAVVGTRVGAQIFSGLSEGLSSTPEELAWGDLADVALADIDGDDRQDVVSLAWGADPAVVHLSRPGGWLDVPIPGNFWWHLEAGDVTGDGRMDVVGYAEPGGRRAVVVSAQRPDGSFAPQEIYPVPVLFGGLAVGDVTGDERDDVVVTSSTNYPFNYVFVFPQRPEGGLGSPVRYRAMRDVPQTPRLADVNQDGRLDVVVAHGGWMAFGVFLQLATGKLGTEQLTGAPAINLMRFRGLAVGDVNSDGRDDVALANAHGGFQLSRWNAARPPRDLDRDRLWIRDTTPVNFGTHPPDRSLTITFALDVAWSLLYDHIRLRDALTGREIPVSVAYNRENRRVTIRPANPLAHARPYYLLIEEGLVEDALYRQYLDEDLWLRFVTDGTPDTVGPETTFDVVPDSQERRTSARIWFSADEAGSTFECRLGEAGWEPCSSPHTLRDLSARTHSFAVRATDQSENVEATPAVTRWTVDDLPAPNVLSNGSFEASFAGWAAYGSVLSSAEGVVGDRAVRVTATGSTAAGFAVAPSPVEMAVPWATYTARAWVRPTAPGSQVCLRLRQWTGSYWGADTECVTGIPTWQQIVSVSLGPTPRTATIELDAYLPSPQGGDSFDLDGVSLTEIPDTTTPTTTIRSGPRELTNDRTAGFVFEADEGQVEWECRLDGGAWTWCFERKVYSGVADGDHVFEVRATDRAGNVEQSPAAWRWRVRSEPITDITPPDTELLPQYEQLERGHFRLHFLSDDQSATFECRLDTPLWSPCTSPKEYTGLAEGFHSFHVRARDASANVDPTPEYRPLRVDPPPPPPPGPGNLLPNGSFERTATGWEASGELEFVDDGIDGGYAARLAAYPNMGYSIRAAPPPVTNTARRSYRASVWMRSDEPGGIVCLRLLEVRRDPDTSQDDLLNTAQSCLTVSPQWQAVAPVVLEGDGGGRLDVVISNGVSYARPVEIDAATLTESAMGPTNPTLSSDHPSSWSNDRTVDVTWSGASASGSGVDGFSYEWSQSATTSPDLVKDAEETAAGTTSPPLADGEWWFHLRTRDNDGNWSAPVRAGPFKVDTTAPANPTPFSSSHAVGGWSNDPSVDISWSGAADTHSGVDGYSLEWSQTASTTPDQVKDMASSSTTSSELTDGDWWFHLRTRDLAGNWSGAVHFGPFRIDTTTPSNPTLSSPSHEVATWSAERTVIVQWSRSVGVRGYSYEWSLSEHTVPDTTEDADGTTTRLASERPDGTWWFHLRAVDTSGRWTGANHIGPFYIDTTPPDTAIVAGPTGPTSSTQATFAFSSSEGDGFDCSLDGAPLAPCASPRSYWSLADGDHVFRVRASDLAGNVDPTPAEHRWTILAPPPPAPSPQPPPPPAPPAPPPSPPRTDRGAHCVVPRLTGRTVARARVLAARSGCRIGRIRAVYSRSVAKGRVISQAPKAGRHLGRGARMHLTISLGRRPSRR